MCGSLCSSPSRTIRNVTGISRTRTRRLGTSRRTAHRIISSATRSDQVRRTPDEPVNVRHDVFPFFVGVARSGTTLLRAMVDSHPEIGIPPESYFVTELAPSRARYEASGPFDVEHFAGDL